MRNKIHNNKWIALLLGLFVPLIANSHPHSFIDLTNQVWVEDALLKGFKMQWGLDEIASAELIYEMKAAKNSQEAKASITKDLIKTAIENHYFSYLYDSQGKPIKFSAKPSDYFIETKQNRIIFHLTVPVAKPQVLTQAVQFLTYEPSYYMAMEYNSPSDLSISQAGCQATLTEPQVNQSLKSYASSLDKNAEPEMADDEMNSLGANFAQKVTIQCPK